MNIGKSGSKLIQQGVAGITSMIKRLSRALSSISRSWKATPKR